MNDPAHLPRGRAVALALLALAVAGLAWLLAARLGAVLGTEAFWPLDRLGAVLAALAGLEALLARWRR